MHRMIRTPTRPVDEIVEDAAEIVDLTLDNPALDDVLALTDSAKIPLRLTVDERIRARHIAVRRSEGHRRLRRLVYATVITLSVGAVWFVLRSPLLAVSHISATGSTHAGAAGLALAAGITPDQAMIDVDVAAAANKLVALPWIKYAKVERNWPNGVALTVVERQPAAQVVLANQAYVFDTDGVLLDTAVPDLRLTTVEGITPPSAKGKALSPADTAIVRFAAGIPFSVRAMLGIDALVAVPDAGLQLRLHGGVVVRLGTPDQPRAKVLSLAAVLKTPAGSAAKTIDVSVPALPVASA